MAEVSKKRTVDERAAARVAAIQARKDAATKRLADRQLAEMQDNLVLQKDGTVKPHMGPDLFE